MHEGSVQYAHICTLAVIHARRVRATICTYMHIVSYTCTCTTCTCMHIVSYTCTKGPYNIHMYAYWQLYMHEVSVQYAHVCTLSVIHARGVRTICTYVHVASCTCAKRSRQANKQKKMFVFFMKFVPFSRGGHNMENPTLALFTQGWEKRRPTTNKCCGKKTNNAQSIHWNIDTPSHGTTPNHGTTGPPVHTKPHPSVHTKPQLSKLIPSAGSVEVLRGFMGVQSSNFSHFWNPCGVICMFSKTPEGAAPRDFLGPKPTWDHF